MTPHDWHRTKETILISKDKDTTLNVWRCSRCSLIFPMLDAAPGDDGEFVTILYNRSDVRERTHHLADCDEEKAREIHDS